jgi:polyisoprenoid-binding protein YceI
MNSKPYARLAVHLFAGLAILLAASGWVAAAEYAVEPGHRSIYFAVGHYDISYVRGRFLRLNATVQFDATAQVGTVVVDVEAGSVDTGNRTLDEVLRSPQFLDTASFPEVRYVGDRFVFEGNQLVAVDGTLWLHGFQKPLRLTAQRFVCKDVAAGLARNHVCGGMFRATFNRSEFGMTRFLPDVADRVELEINVEAVRK